MAALSHFSFVSRLIFQNSLVKSIWLLLDLSHLGFVITARLPCEMTLRVILTTPKKFANHPNFEKLMFV